MNKNNIPFTKLALLSALTCSIFSAAAQDISKGSSPRINLARYGLGYRNIQIVKAADNPYNDSFKIDAPVALKVALIFFLTDKVAVELSPGVMFGKFNYTEASTGYTVYTPPGSYVAGTFNFALQYYFNQSGTIKPYVGAGCLYQIIGSFYDAPRNGRKLFSGGSGGGLFAQVGLDTEITKNFYFNMEFQHTFPVSHELDIVKLSIKSKYNIANSAITLGITMKI